jgi:Ser/Thr protein kinase RdoA (MazF antagonist)
VSAVAAAPSDAELRAALERALTEVGAAAPREIVRASSPYRTSFPLEELTVGLGDGSELRLAFKRIEWDALSADGRLAKPSFLHDPLRERAVYAHVLPAAEPGAPRYHGSLLDPDAGRCWLFVEWVAGRELYQVGERGLWEEVARWLGRTHARLGADLDRHLAAGRLLDHDGAYYGRWLERARRFAAEAGDEARSLALDRLAAGYETVLDGILALPRTVIHGELYASNVLVAGDPADPRVCPVDWELAAAAPGILDLAALVSGGWGEEDRAAIVAAYRATAPDDFSDRQLDLARLQVAVQWLGWAGPGWLPPEGQRHDWLAEALALMERLGL